MKVFISHSSRDRWIARRISQDLNAIGVETFLDEKDIETGASIDEMIGDHLKDCDDCLMLLSPTALNSHWVLVEIGGAKALGKRLIPVLLHIGANEMPAPISKLLARDINEIDRYYEELKQRLAGEKIPEKQPKTRKPSATRRRTQTFKVGDHVKIISSKEQAALARDDLGWIDEMDIYAGEEATITMIYKDMRAADLDIDEGEFYWAFEWLTKI